MKEKKGAIMNAVDIITKKKNGMALTSEEIEFMVMGYTLGSVPDYQMSALLMAIVLNGMSLEETVTLTEIMRDSGDVMDLSAIKGTKVDKHSTGGVGDKTTLIAAPVAAAAGVPIAKMSGRGLGFTGGTVDKMESIPGFRTSMEKEEFIDAVNSRGIAVIGQTGRIAPADKKMYALRDVTGTTESLALITGSIMSKKLAAGSDAILLDVKCGSGAFMKTEEEACRLAQWMVNIGNAAGKKTMALISDMNQPLGRAVGNALEVIEVIDVLKGEGPEDITELSLNLAGAMIMLGGLVETIEDGYAKAARLVKEGAALEKFSEFIRGQGGNPEIVRDCSILGSAEHSLQIKAQSDGIVTELDAMTIGLASQHAGAGRAKKEDEIDMTAGIVLNKKTGDTVKKGETLCSVFGNNPEKLEQAGEEAGKAYVLGKDIPPKRKLIKQIITKELLT